MFLNGLKYTPGIDRASEDLGKAGRVLKAKLNILGKTHLADRYRFFIHENLIPTFIYDTHMYNEKPLPVLPHRTLPFQLDCLVRCK